ncbi:GNAT family N-acetyltransferase [Virgibacillus dakarensis]|uniref:N-acetyltransferase n=1 Tax=Lentibacillus populi TaxID=1827502 RepID=A0A9W5X4A9_9BACI|nr:MULTISPECIES: GNAT family N-acetyltransferase [Bacillaceae]MBT2214343.1 GNAT family N-acetyltransferase [Virgibacillus dakarensis]MTW85020.1 GNAT family N-acetyltransferase [Virgibacillus dakarensis]GGB34118.1 N-acetyltransferase [Lentibacillus populi]
MSLFLSGNLARRIEQSEIEALKSRLTAIKEMDGNPMNVEIKEFGNATAFSVKNIPGPSFNTVKGISGSEEKYLDAILEFYKERGVPARFEITPAHASLELFKALHEKGYFQSGFHTALAGSLSHDVITNEETDASISIRKIREHEFETFGDIYTKGFHMPSFLKEHVAQNNKVLYNHDNWTFYLASYEGEPAGIGVLFEYDGIGTLAASATIPELRNRGVHSALILKRLQQAKQHNCNLIVGQATYGSVSQKNMERAGMRIAYTKSIWAKL